MLGVAQLINEAWAHEVNTQDNEVAQRLYKAAYTNLLDINNQVTKSGMNVMAGVSPFEIRSVGDYINYRSCQIFFLLNHPREAITQFRKHIDVFKQHTKSPEYAFEHAAWLSQQYLMFAEMFHEAVVKGVKASWSQHPGHYYYNAAMQMIARRTNVTEYTNDMIRSTQMPVTKELLRMINPIGFASYLRQSGWVCVEPNDAPPVNPTSQPQPNFEPIDYSEIIIRSLYRAIEYFGQWTRPRMQNYLSVIIAEEHLLHDNRPKARALFIKSLEMLEQERWIKLADHIRGKISYLDIDQE